MAMLLRAERIERLPVLGNVTPDGLPIIELKPFTQKQWRPANSLPSAYISRTAYAIGMSPRRTRWYSEPTSVVVSPRESEPPPSQRQAITTTDNRPQNHPKTRNMPLGVQQPQGFVPKLEREKTTTLDIRSSSGAPTGNEPMLVHGRKVDNRAPSRPCSIYAPPWTYYQSSRGTSVTAPLTSNTNIPHLADEAYMHLDKTIYDSFDRSHTLPSINVRPVAMRRRRRARMSQQESTPESGSSSRRSSGRRSRHHGYRLGVANALDVFSRVGQPLFVERQITFQLKNTMRRLRRNRDTSPVSSAGQSVPSTERFDHSIVPTVGEAMIRAGWMMNAGRLPRDFNPLDDVDDDPYCVEHNMPAYNENAGLDQQVTGRTSVQSPRKRLTSDRKRNAIADADRKMPNITELDRAKTDVQKSSPKSSEHRTASDQPENVLESTQQERDASADVALSVEVVTEEDVQIEAPVLRIEVDVSSELLPVMEHDFDGDVTGENDNISQEQEEDAKDVDGNYEEEVRSVYSDNIVEPET